MRNRNTLGPHMHKTTLHLDRRVVAEVRRLWPEYDLSFIIRDLLARAIRSRVAKLGVTQAPPVQDPENVILEI